MQGTEVPTAREAMHWAFRPAPLDLGPVTVEVHGTPAIEALWRLADAIEPHTSAGATVILDLDGLVLTSSRTMRGFIAHLNARGMASNTVLRCSRSTGRKLLRRWAGSSMPIVGRDARGR
ncbi:MAG TPA: hypothetical protein DCS55_10390 [Acidimicrobiaceae bacterium]|nr:hypothetical protein [Acidimicrobiaceae bacterium]|tara:strand:+ start:116 stop:475 length:360 start_codon:yes stop_codon:yes gene_type:complete